MTRSLPAILAAFWATLAIAQVPQPASLTLVGGRVYASPDAAPIADAVVRIDAGRITAVGPADKVAVPEGTPTLDCKGLAIVAGFQNSHVHFTDPARWSDAASRSASRLTVDLQEMLTQDGFTTVVDTASDLANTLALRRRIESGEVNGPRILTAGAALYPADGVPYYVRDVVPAEVVRTLPQPAVPDAAARIVRTQLSAGADLVKLFTGSWVQRGTVKPMPVDIATAAVREADRLGKPVFAHASNVAGLEVAIRSGVDVLAHPIDDTRGLTRGHLEQLIARRVAVVPTLALFRGDADVIDELRGFARLGGDVLFGTDIGYLPDFDTADEFRLLAAAGLGWREILASLTTTPARRFGEEALRGRVAAGMTADLVVLAASPGADVLEPESFARVRYTIRAGRVIYDASSADAVGELKAMQHRLVRTVLSRQRDEYASMLAPEWRVTHISGQVMTKAQVLEMVFGSPEAPFKDAVEDEIEVRLMGETAAVVSGRNTVTLHDGSRLVLRFTDVVHRRDGRWVVVSSHATQVR